MSSQSKRISEDLAKHLGNYVYILVDPRNSRPFYVGKGQGSRALTHAADAAANTTSRDMDVPAAEVKAKVKRIQSIQDAGEQPEIWIVRYGLTKAEYTSVEASLIDVLQSFPVEPSVGRHGHRPLDLTDDRDLGVTNARREAAREHGLVLLSELIAEWEAPPLTTSTPLLLIKLNTWKDGEEGIAGGRTRHGAGFKRQWLDPQQRERDADTLMAGASAWWRVDPRRVEREGIEYAAAVYGGVTRGLMRIVPGTWESVVTTTGGLRRAFQFETVKSGDLFDEVVGEYGHRVPGLPRGAQNPIRYWSKR